jgi:tryptophan synthase beta chain
MLSTPTAEGYYGAFGGAYVPELLRPNLDELNARYEQVLADPVFQRELHGLLRHYAGRPTPLYGARNWNVNGAKLFLKREDLCHTGAHKINNALGQVLLARRLGKTRVIAETGAGQHGVATASACALLGMPCVVYMGEVDMTRQAPNVARMRLMGATVVPVTSGSRTLKDATNEAIRDWIGRGSDTHYVIGSVVGPHPYPHLVLRLQSIIGQEVREQLAELTGTQLPHRIVACVGGGSNAAGIFHTFLHEPSVELIAVEAAGEGLQSGRSAATTALGTSGVLHGSLTLLMQDEDGQVVEPHSISAGLDYPGIGPLHAHLFTTGRVLFTSVTDQEALKAGRQLARCEGILPALESAHALAALQQLRLRPDEVVVLCLSGRGDKDLDTYTERALP